MLKDYANDMSIMIIDTKTQIKVENSFNFQESIQIKTQH